MNTHPETHPSSHYSRRRFLQTSAAGTLAGTLSASRILAQNQAPSPGDTLRVGLIGCGGRGTGAAAQAMEADSNVRLVAMGDAFEDRLNSSLQTLKQQEAIAEKIDVAAERRFAGFDAYQRVIDSGVDVVLLATPPHFRPIHLKAAIEAGKHVFAEKPVAVDAPGVRMVLALAEEARRRRLSIVSGLALRYSHGHRELVRRIHDGALGTIRTLQANDFRGPIWVKPRQPGWSDMYYHMRNWYYFTWLSGDFNVEQHIHLLDLCAWIMNGEYPVSAMGIGGRQVRTGAEYGNIYDHHAVIYEYANGVKLHAYCRQQAGCVDDISVQVAGSSGVADLSRRNLSLNTETRWSYRGEQNNSFLTEHQELFASIRQGQPINNGEYMANSTLMTILGRMATYTGQKITWEQAMHSREDLSPEAYHWDAKPPVSEIARPGFTKFV
jgi:predicted dehydrogenase